MADQNVLLLLLDDPAEKSELREEIERRRGDVHVRVVAPAHVGLLAWYTTDEDEAHGEAADQARGTARRLRGTADVEGAYAGEADPVLAVEDALEEFPADEILIAGGNGGYGTLVAALEQFGLPVSRLGAPGEEHGDELRGLGRGIMSGRSAATPYAVALGVVAALAAVVLLMIVFGVLVLWLT